VSTARRLLALTTFCDRRLGDAFLARAANTYGSGIAVSYAILVALEPSAAAPLLDRALTTMAWVPGVVIALVAARDADSSADESGTSRLARLRGFGPEELRRARFLGTALRITRVIGLRALLLTLFACSRASETLLTEARWAAGVAVFAVVLGTVLALLSRVAAALVPERGRFLLMAGAAVASVLGLLWPSAPSLGKFFDALPPSLLGIGGT
jgi:hypothetical protein